METIKTHIKNKSFDHFYFFCGEEVYLSQYYLNQLKNLLVKDLSFDFLSIDCSDISNLQEAVEGAPLMSEHRLVVVKGLDLSAELKQADTEFIAQLLPNVPFSTCLVFVTRTIKKNSKIYKLLNDNCTVCLFEHQKPSQLVRWLLNMTQKQNIKLDRDTAALLIEYAGVDMTTLLSEMDKLVSYCRDEGQITKSAIEEIVIKSVDAKIYFLLDAVFAGKSEEAFLLLSEFKKENEKPIYINASILGTIRTLLEQLYLSEEGKSASEITEKLHLRPIQAKKNTAYLKKTNKKFLENMLKRCVDLDMQIKTGADGYAGLFLAVGEMLSKNK